MVQRQALLNENTNILNYKVKKEKLISYFVAQKYKRLKFRELAQMV